MNLEKIKNELLKQQKILANTSLNSYNDFLKASRQKLEKSIEWNENIIKINEKIEKLNGDLTFLKASMFLLFFEVNYVAILDIVCLLYIKNGHDLYDSLRHHFAKNFESIGRIDTYTKFQFLKNHNLELLVRENDNQLRNKIAHLNFSVISGNRIRIQDKDIDIVERIVELNHFVKDISGIMTDSTNIVTADLNKITEQIKSLIKK